MPIQPKSFIPCRETPTIHPDNRIAREYPYKGIPTSGLVCPKCEKGQACVLDARVAEGRYRRRRGCNFCGYRWTTQEAPLSSVDPVEAARQARSALADLVIAAQEQMLKIDKLLQGEADG